MKLLKSLYSPLRVGFIHYLLVSFLAGLVLISYIFTVTDTSFVDTLGGGYFIISCFAHAALVCLIPFIIIYLPLTLCKINPKISGIVTSVLYIIILLLLIINRYVFSIYHFHVNGIIISLLTGPGAGDIFVFDTIIYIKAAVILLITVIAVLFLLFVAFVADKKLPEHKFYKKSLLTLGIIIIFSQILHIYGAAAMKISVLETTSYIPYYFPVSMNSLLKKAGIISYKDLNRIKITERKSDLNYPKKELKEDKKKLYNIVIIGIDSWNKRSFTQQCMPNITEFARNAEYYSDHISSSNGTRGSLFGLFTGLSSYYWKSFEYTSLQPLLIEYLINNNYNIQVYPSATFNNPPFARMFFSNVPGINTESKGKKPYHKDCYITKMFLNDLEKADTTKPFFSFIFYDLAHAISVPAQYNTHFQPAWKFPDYSKLSNTTDPLPFWNLYRNCVYQIDSLAGMVLNKLKEKNLLDNTIVIITGDHGQEFNENKKNYWGHDGNFSIHQIGVPFIFYYPECTPKTVKYRTTHYDVSPTIMKMNFGITNSPEDYSMGKYLWDSSQRNWIVVGSDINYAFIIQNDMIVEKNGAGYMTVFDRNLNRTDWFPSAKELNDAIKILNGFYK
ncbi:MAG: DUF3413 domain-containing protein [Bacteroidales bacterium]|nr:DUF3413 domain-containing protein [Bacteroidales bacterium]